MAPFIGHRWATQQVAFPTRRRLIPTGYATVSAAQFDHVLRAQPNIEIISGQRVAAATPTGLTLDDGTHLSGRAVFDGRGPQRSAALSLGFQKFLGLEVEFDAPHGLAAPIIMDATVPQTDGYRFIYVLPLTDRTALIEDTYYADGPALPKTQLREEIHAYAEAKGWTIRQTLREEEGILPITLDGDIDAFWAELRGGPVPLGLRAGLFHPITGYSIAAAINLADVLAHSAHTETGPLADLVEAHARQHWQAQGYFRMLNRMLFRAAAPEQRYIVLQRFYGLPVPLINRFYAGNLRWTDKIRILAGKPPVPVGAALKALPAKHEGHLVEEGLLG